MVAGHASIRYEQKTLATTRGGKVSGSGAIEDASWDKIGYGMGR